MFLSSVCGLGSQTKESRKPHGVGTCSSQCPLLPLPHPKSPGGKMLGPYAMCMVRGSTCVPEAAWALGQALLWTVKGRPGLFHLLARSCETLCQADMGPLTVSHLLPTYRPLHSGWGSENPRSDQHVHTACLTPKDDNIIGHGQSGAHVNRLTALWDTHATSLCVCAHGIARWPRVGGPLCGHSAWERRSL